MFLSIGVSIFSLIIGTGIFRGVDFILGMGVSNSCRWLVILTSIRLGIAMLVGSLFLRFLFI